MSSKYIKKYSIPPGFQSLLSEFTKEILRNQPKDIVDFAVEYFKCLQQGLILDYPHRGQNIPCDFKPAIPKIPDLLKNQINYDKIEEEYTQQKPQIGEKKDEEKKEEIIEKKKEKIIEEKKEEIKEEKKVMKDKLIQIEYPNIVEKEKKNTVIQTGSSVKNTLYENCIDFGEKEEILEKLKENPENQAEIEEYINTNFLPNKNINELVALLQKTIMSYYNTKGTEKESEYNTLREEVDNKIKVLKENNPLIDKDFESLDIKEAVNEFKNYGYYQRILKVYIYKLNHLYEENNELLDEISFFIFANHLKMITSEDHPVKVLEDKPYIERYFLQNFQLLLPEVYSFVLGINQYNEPETINLFSSFSFRKRELCHKFYIFYNIKKMGRQERKKSELLEKYLFISSPSQILEKMTTVTDDNKLEVFDSITEKLQQNFPAIWQFISRVVNIPIELVNSSFDIFMGFNTISREIILNYLKLGEEYKDIYDIFSGVKIDNTESNFSSSMDRIYFELKYIPELNYRNFCIYRNKLFNIPDSIKEFIMKFETGDWASEEENLLKEYETKN